VRDCREVREDEASPRKTASDRLRRRMSSSERRPTRTPTFDFGTVVILSTIIRHVMRNALRGLRSTGSRNNGASVSSLVKAPMVIESVALKLSSCTITTGRGFPP
jgi:hypothetical protein